MDTLHTLFENNQEAIEKYTLKRTQLSRNRNAAHSLAQLVVYNLNFALNNNSGTLRDSENTYPVSYPLDDQIELVSEALAELLEIDVEDAEHLLVWREQEKTLHVSQEGLLDLYRAWKGY